ncbi:MAG: DUF169 domain-containing protein [Deltaproteobacteria bacterium]|nr:DUF169 domain-containing protein [Deltaproteobacteria bacterium]
MTELDRIHEYGEELEQRIRLKTYPLAVRLLRDESEIPERTLRPLKNLKRPMPLCQGLALSRKEGLAVAMFKEDMVCCEPIIGLGFAEAPQYFLDGNNRYPEDVMDLNAGKNYASDFPRLEVGKYRSIISAPLKQAAFLPDIIMIYCNSEQISLLLLGREAKDGHDLKCSLSSHAACVYSVVPVIKKGECQVSIPCRGDRYIALAGEDELILSVPADKLGELIEGLRYVEKANSRLPRTALMGETYPLPPSYFKILEML